MRIRLGRPDLGRYRDRFDAPQSDGAFGVTFLGVSTLHMRDGESAVLTDGFFSRPALRKVALRRLAPDPARIEAALGRAGIDSLDAVAPVHTHVDHAMDSAVVAERTGAVLVGGESASMIGIGHGLPDARVDVVTSGQSRTFGAFRLTWVASEHCRPTASPDRSRGR